MIIIKRKVEPTKEPSRLKCLWWKIKGYWQNIKDFFNPKNEWFYERVFDTYLREIGKIKNKLCIQK